MVIGHLRVKVTAIKEAEMSSNSDSSTENDACEKLLPIQSGRRKKKVVKVSAGRKPSNFETYSRKIKNLENHVSICVW